MKPVSYTHLDVYKRQLQCWGFNEAGQAVNVTGPYTQVASGWSVSYTHLDVYKRQVPGLRERQNGDAGA